MRRIAMTVIVTTILVLPLVSGCTKGYESQKNADDLKITLSVGRYPLVMGDNALNVKVNDASGKPVTDATVNVHYFMPAMPGMAPMDYNTQAVAKGEAYSFIVNIPMEGGWKTEVFVSRAGKPASSAMFNVDAR